MTSEQTSVSREGKAKNLVSESLLVPSLAFANLAAYIPTSIVGILLVDIAKSFDIQVGLAGQLQTGTSIAGVVAAFLLAALSVRFNRKTLLLAGLAFLGIAALLCSIVPNFISMLIFYSISGFGLAMVGPMANAIVGERLPLEKRGSAVGWIIAGMVLSAFIVGLMVIFVGNWRLLFQAFVLPSVIAGFLLAYKGIPSAARKTPGQTSSSYLHGFKDVFSNRSAIACLTCTILCVIAGTAITTYVLSFYRQRFFLSRELVSAITMILVPVYVVGSLTAGRLVNRYGRKLLALVSAVGLGAFTVALYNLPSLWLSLALCSLGILFAGMRLTAGNSLTLEQVPAFRGTLMSINQAALSIGSSIGLAIGGLLLLMFDYYAVGIVLGAMGILAAVIYHFLANDPSRSSSARAGD